MIVVGLEDIGLESFKLIQTFDDIAKTKPNTIIQFSFDRSLMQYCQENALNYAVEVDSIEQVIFANLLEASFIIISQELALEAQKIADHYMFDPKILVKIDTQEKIAWAASNLIDGVILQ